MRQLDQQDGGLQGIESEVSADQSMVVLRLRPMGTHHHQSIMECSVVCHHHSPVARTTKVLAGEKAEAAYRAEASGLPTLICGRDCLRGILDDVQIVLRAISMMGSMSHIWPKRWTGMIAFVRLVIARSILLGSMLNVRGSISTNTGNAPTRAIHPAVAKKVNGVVMTSSPGPMPSAIRLHNRASVPLETPAACLQSDRVATFSSIRPPSGRRCRFAIPILRLSRPALRRVWMRTVLSDQEEGLS